MIQKECILDTRLKRAVDEFLNDEVFPLFIKGDEVYYLDVHRKGAMKDKFYIEISVEGVLKIRDFDYSRDVVFDYTGLYVRSSIKRKHGF